MSALQIILPLFSGAGGLACIGAWRYGQRIHRAVERIEAQTQNNGGSSMRDSIDRIEARVVRIEKRQKRIQRRVHALEVKESNA